MQHVRFYTYVPYLPINHPNTYEVGVASCGIFDRFHALEACPLRRCHPSMPPIHAVGLVITP